MTNFEEVFSPDERYTLFTAEHSAGSPGSMYPTIEAYYIEKDRQIETGAETWMVRNMEADWYVYGLWLDKQEISLVSDDPEGVEVYVLDRTDDAVYLDEFPTLIDGIDAARRYWGLQ